MLAGRNIRYQVADRARAVGCGGIGAIHLLARRVGLIQAIDGHVRLLKRHLPYHESDHVLSLAYNVLAGGTCIEDLERLRSDEAYLDALGAQRIPDPTTAGDFCRRFENEQQVLTLMETINQTRLTVWKQQEGEFFDRAVLDADGTIAPTFVQGGNEHQLRWAMGLPPAADLAGQHQRAVVPGEPLGQPPQPRAGDEYPDKALTLAAASGVQVDPAPRRHRLHADLEAG